MPIVHASSLSGLIDPRAGFPTAATTGVQGGTPLTVYTGSNILSTNNQVFENWIVTTPLVVTGVNVTIRNCFIRALANDTFFVIDVRDGATGCTIQYCDIIGPGVNGPCSAVINAGNASGLTVDHCDISQGEHGIALGTGVATITENYLHDPDIDPNAVGGDKHVGGVSFKGGQNGVLVQHNTMSCPNEGTSDIFVQAQFAAIANVTLDHNLCDLNPGFDIFVEDRFGFTCNNVTIINNVLFTGQFGVYSLNITISSQPYFANNTIYPGIPVPQRGTPQLDGSASVAGSSGTSINVGPITSAQANGLVVVMIYNDLSSGSAGGPNDVTGITGGGLTFTRRALVSNAAGKDIQEWTAQVGSSPLSAVTFTVAYGAAATLTSISAFVVSSPVSHTVLFEAGGPQTSTSASPSITTTGLALLVGAARYSTTGNPTAGTNWTGILDGATGSFMNSEYRVNASQGSGSPFYTPQYTANDGTAFITDAFYTMA